jgi:hypothetical protein
LHAPPLSIAEFLRDGARPELASARSPSDAAFLLRASDGTQEASLLSARSFPFLQRNQSARLATFFCNAPTRFGKEEETVRRPRVVRATDHNPKTERENQNMKNKINQSAAMLLACAALTLSAIVPTFAGDQVPFKGTVSGQIPVDLGPPDPSGCIFNFFVSNTGNATHLGSFTGTSNFIPNVCDGSYTGTFRWIAANGDEITGPFFGQQIPTPTPGVFDNIETAIITGGTGRFAGATGMFTLTGQVNFVTRTFVLPFQGTISRANRN